MEVADSSLERDRTSKLRSYARAGIVVYWIVNLIERQVELYKLPLAKAEPPRYDHCEIFKVGDSVPLVIDGRELGRIVVADMLA